MLTTLWTSEKVRIILVVLLISRETEIRELRFYETVIIIFYLFHYSQIIDKSATSTNY
jgi:hypothetical protein